MICRYNSDMVRETVKPSVLLLLCLHVLPLGDIKEIVKPTLGDLVRYDKRIYPKGWDQTALERIGLVVYTEGVRCAVRWCYSMKKSALIERISLEVINASR